MNLKETLQKYIDEKWIVSQRHPTLPLNIYNYSQATQFDKKWDEITLQCRGLVLDDEGNVAARPFKKFFNWEEIIYTTPAEQWSKSFEVFDKMDGSLGIGFWYNGEFIFSTRGSFMSDQAIKAKELLNEYNFEVLDKAYTYLFEILYPENRVVVDYGGVSELVLLGAIHTSTGEELSYTDLSEITFATGFPLVAKLENMTSFEDIKALNWENKEGVVIRFEDGLRMKIKFADYCALHRILTNCSSYDIWENLKEFGELPKELFEKVPDEFFGWVREIRDGIMSNFNWIDATARAEFKIIKNSMKDVPPEEFDKAFAHRVMNHKLRGLLFALKNGRDISQAIWKMVKPDYSKPFAEKG